ncbi:hypothetical protein SteCoe_958 [Stentor coeruleus]|uniref:Uncharacterized protein n=1 Tax=Stentor coeruleus TaxID=5963 RepID=A0A1R2D2Q5_9CILI|nr:hypothetical protein SteCoe_958 [Stentor coeruleus]
MDPYDYPNDELSPIETHAGKKIISSITNEWKPNVLINQSVCASTWHEYYMENPLDQSPENTDCKCSNLNLNLTMKCEFQEKYMSLLKKYYKDTAKLKDKIKDLRNEITLAYQENGKLRTDLSSLQQDYSLNIQNIQARHQQKLLRTKNDIESLVNALKNEYDEKILALKSDYELELIKFQENNSEEKLIEFQKNLENEFQQKTAEEIQKITEKYEAQINRLRKEKSSQRVLENKRILEINTESTNKPSEIEGKLEQYEKLIKELQQTIINQEKNIVEMSSSLGATFKRRISFTPAQINKILQVLQAHFSQYAEQIPLGLLLETLKPKLES